MVYGKACLIILFVVLIIIIGLIQKVEVLYIKKDGCRPSEKLEMIIDNITKNIGRIKYNKIEFNNELKTKYNIHGIPVIIINGRVMEKNYTEENIKKEICKHFILSPMGCW